MRMRKATRQSESLLSGRLKVWFAAAQPRPLRVSSTKLFIIRDHFGREWRLSAALALISPPLQKVLPLSSRSPRKSPEFATLRPSTKIAAPVRNLVASSELAAKHRAAPSAARAGFQTRFPD